MGRNGTTNPRNPRPLGDESPYRNPCYLEDFCGERGLRAHRTYFSLRSPYGTVIGSTPRNHRNPRTGKRREARTRPAETYAGIRELKTQGWLLSHAAGAERIGHANESAPWARGYAKRGAARESPRKYRLSWSGRRSADPVQTLPTRKIVLSILTTLGGQDGNSGVPAGLLVRSSGRPVRTPLWMRAVRRDGRSRGTAVVAGERPQDPLADAPCVLAWLWPRADGLRSCRCLDLRG